MPVRDYRTPGVVRVSDNGVTQTFSWDRCLGLAKRISALNNAGTFVPGSYRVNPVVIETYSVSGGGGGCSFKYNGREYKANGDLGAWAIKNRVDLFTAPNTIRAYSSVAAQQALTRSYADMKSAELEFGTMLGELGETIEGLRNPLSALRKFAKQAAKTAKRGRGPGVGQAADAVSGTWLEYRYGIMPLVYSVQDILKFITDQIERVNNKLLRSKGYVGLASQPVYDIQIGAGPLTFLGKVRVTEASKYAARVYWRYNRALTYSELLGTDLTNLPGIAWELATLSFVWDWFFAVGDWLESIRYDSARTIVGNCVSEKQSVFAHAQITGCRLYSYPTVYPASGSATASYERLTRKTEVVKSSLPTPNLEALSLVRKLDAVSLAWQSLPKPRRLPHGR